MLRQAAEGRGVSVMKQAERRVLMLEPAITSRAARLQALGVFSMLASSPHCVVTHVCPVVSRHVSLMSTYTLTDANVLPWEGENDPAPPSAACGLQILQE